MAESGDNLEPLVTQCPNCATRFRVSEQQLQAASGRVRCGACLLVFDGTASLTIDGETVAEPGDDDIDALLHELEEAGDLASESPSAANEVLDTGPDKPDVPVSSSARSSGWAPSSQIPAAFEKAGAQQTSAETEADAADDLDALVDASVSEAFADAEDDNDEMADPGPAVGLDGVEGLHGTGLQNADLQSAGLQDADDGLSKLEADLMAELRGEVTTSRTADNVPDENVPDENAPDEVEAGVELEAVAPASAEVSQSADTPETPETPESAAHAEPPEVRTHEAEAGIDPSAPASLNRSRDTADETGTTTPVPGSGAGLASLLEAELAQAIADDSARPRLSLVTVALLVVMVIAIPAQILWFQFESWSKNEHMRPLYAQICNVVGCELPLRTDVSAIDAENAVLRPHPEQADALIYDALLINGAEFAQPFPLLELTLTSIRGHLVAGRRFAPEEYLRGDVLRNNLMPPKTPIHVSLEIKAPAQTALNFRIRFLQDTPQRRAQAARMQARDGAAAPEDALPAK